ncbi:hypothetical protein B0J13DRAFT_660649 [Dactylonectria estremocensis]|uniref:Uncharacterized protein n=1 Tax=Dactylonectria estremocensis TaxID=1079267 RepID=A0A9P9J915_9HYPO|nr:hypothetical protein B0J13DRAFT_660649 [Dactylonectria estremocensis]
MSRFSPQLTGAHVLVTGGSKGIGRVIVESFLAEGANVSWGSRSVRPDEFSLFKGATDGAREVGSTLDIGDPAAIRSWVDKAAKDFGKIDIVVANACPFYAEATPEAWEKSFQSDILGLWTLIDAATPHLEARGGTGSIVVISSAAGFQVGHPGVGGPYSTFKRAQAIMARDHARKLASKGIRVNTVVPGAIETPSILRPDGTEELSMFKAAMQQNPAYFESLFKQIPLGTAGEAQDIANAVVYLSSHLAKYVSGANLVVDGALTEYY